MTRTSLPQSRRSDRRSKPPPPRNGAPILAPKYQVRSSEPAPEVFVRHKSELDCIKPADMSDEDIIKHCQSHAFDVPPRNPNASDPWTLIRTVDGQSIAIPRAYRVPLLITTYRLWGLIQYAFHTNGAEWEEMKFDILHLSRLCASFLDQAREATANKTMHKHWRCPTLDRVLTRLYLHWFSTRDEWVEEFWKDCGEDIYEEDPLRKDWLRWISKEPRGLKLGKERALGGMTANELMGRRRAITFHCGKIIWRQGGMKGRHGVEGSSPDGHEMHGVTPTDSPSGMAGNESQSPTRMTGSTHHKMGRGQSNGADDEGSVLSEMSENEGSDAPGAGDVEMESVEPTTKGQVVDEKTFMGGEPQLSIIETAEKELSENTKTPTEAAIPMRPDFGVGGNEAEQPLTEVARNIEQDLSSPEGLSGMEGIEATGSVLPVEPPVKGSVLVPKTPVPETRAPEVGMEVDPSTIKELSTAVGIQSPSGGSQITPTSPGKPSSHTRQIIPLTARYRRRTVPTAVSLSSMPTNVPTSIQLGPKASDLDSQTQPSQSSPIFAASSSPSAPPLIISGQPQINQSSTVTPPVATSIPDPALAPVQPDAQAPKLDPQTEDIAQSSTQSSIPAASVASSPLNIPSPEQLLLTYPTDMDTESAPDSGSTPCSKALESQASKANAGLSSILTRISTPEPTVAHSVGLPRLTVQRIMEQHSSHLEGLLSAFANSHVAAQGEMSNEIHELKTENEVVGTKNRELQDVVQYLKTEIKALESLNGAVTSQMETLQNQNVELRDENEVLLDDIGELQAENGELQAENGQLRVENAELRELMGGLKTQLAEIQRQISAFSSFQLSIPDGSNPSDLPPQDSSVPATPARRLALTERNEAASSSTSTPVEVELPIRSQRKRFPFRSPA